MSPGTSEGSNLPASFSLQRLTNSIRFAVKNSWSIFQAYLAEISSSVRWHTQVMTVFGKGTDEIKGNKRPFKEWKE